MRNSLLDVIDLRNNQITTLPDSVIAPPAERLEHVARRNNFTIISGNPLSEAAQQQLSAYWSRLEQERPDVWGLRRPGFFEYQAPAMPTERVRLGIAQRQSGVQRWVTDLPPDQAVPRQLQWQALSAQEGANGFFQVLNDLEAAGAGHADLQRRVWDVIDTITEGSPESEAPRGEMFEWAGRPACCDRAALSFSNLEIMALVYRARTLALDAEQGAALLKLSRGLFRLDEVEKIALADINKRVAAINARRDLSAAQKTDLIDRLEDVEVKLAYRFGLKRSGSSCQGNLAKSGSLAWVTSRQQR
ncbi:NEL-type E3 ubiquitin ligase domain-containing protein [Pseudomonas sp. S2_F03]